MNPFLSVVIPAYNEERSLPVTLNSVFKYLKRQNYSWEVVVVDDGSRDDTRNLILEFQKSYKELKLIKNTGNQGKGAAVKNGVLHSDGDLILFMDADNSTKINELEKSLPVIASGADIVIGSRRLKGSVIIEIQPWHRRVLGGFFRSLTKNWLGLPYDDTQAGFKVFNQKARRVFELQTISGFSFDAEILFLAKKMGLNVKEIPIYWENNLDSRVSFKKMFKALVELLVIRFNHYSF